MSTATARSTAARTEAPARRKPEAPARPDLRVLPPQPFTAPRGPFALLVGAVLTLGLLGVLLLNTVVAQDAFALSAMEEKSAALADQEQLLTQEVAAADSPERLESRARSLGMVASVNPLFLRLADGKVLGVPVPAKAPVVEKPKVTAPVTDTRPSTSATAAPGSTTRTGATTPTAVRTKAAAAIRTKAARAQR